MRQMHQRKLIKTQEELEMMNNGLVNVLNILSTEHRKISNFKNCRSLIETLEKTHNKTAVSYTHLKIHGLNQRERQMQEELDALRDKPCNNTHVKLSLIHI